MLLIYCRMRSCKRLLCGLDASAADNGGMVEVVKEHLTKPCCIASYNLGMEIFVKGLAEFQGVQLHIVEKDKQ